MDILLIVEFAGTALAFFGLGVSLPENRDMGWLFLFIGILLLLISVATGSAT